MSSERWTNGAPCTTSSAPSTTDSSPARSMSLMVKTLTSEARSRSRSSCRASGRPTSTVCVLVQRRRRPAVGREAGPAQPRAAASGMPCTLPVGLVSGVLASAWASIQIDRAGPVDPGQAAEHAHRQGVVAAEDQGELAGLRAAWATASAISRAGGQDLRQVLGMGVPGVSVSTCGRPTLPRSRDLEPSCLDARGQTGVADRRRAHVDAAAALPEVEGAADDVTLRRAAAAASSRRETIPVSAASGACGPPRAAARPSGVCRKWRSGTCRKTARPSASTPSPSRRRAAMVSCLPATRSSRASSRSSAPVGTGRR